MVLYFESILTILITMWVAWTYADKCEPTPAELNSTNTIQGIVFPQNDTSLQKCTWVIRAENPNDIIKFQLTDWYRPSQQSSCSKETLVFRDGPDEDSPEIREVCGFTISREVVSTSSNSLYIHFSIDKDDGQHGFGLEYWSENSYHTVSAKPMYETMNYVLMCLSVVVTLAFTSGIIYLLIREKRREQKALKIKMKLLLKQRRKAISGPTDDSYYERSNSDLHTSRTDVPSFVESSLTPSSDV